MEPAEGISFLGGGLQMSRVSWSVLIFTQYRLNAAAVATAFNRPEALRISRRAV